MTLLAHFSLFRSIAPEDPASDLAFPTPGTERGYVGDMGLNYWQTRYIPEVTGLGGRGLWITPGARGLSISDRQAGDCGMLSSQDSAGIIGGGPYNGQLQTLSGLVPDGNPTVTLVLADGSRRIVPVVEHNDWEPTIPGRVVAIISRNTAGRSERRSLR